MLRGETEGRQRRLGWAGLGWAGSVCKACAQNRCLSFYKLQNKINKNINFPMSCNSEFRGLKQNLQIEEGGRAKPRRHILSHRIRIQVLCNGPADQMSNAYARVHYYAPRKHIKENLTFIVSDYQINYNWFKEPFEVSQYKAVYTSTCMK